MQNELSRARMLMRGKVSPHVESVTLLQRMSNTLKKTITLDVDMEDYHRIKSEGRTDRSNENE